jgi:hypothetical protein
MAFTQGIQTLNELTADLATNTDIILNDITGFTFALGANKRIKWQLTGIFSTGATGGFRFRANSTTAPTRYTAQWFVRDVTTPASFEAAQLAAADFTNASAVATDYTLTAFGVLVANTATTFSIQFAQNNSTANNITMRAGMILELWQF